jgi:hypothetical protein
VERAVSTGTRIEAHPLTLSAGMSHRAITERILSLADQAGYKAALVDASEGTVTAWPRFARTVRAAADGLSRRGLADGDTAGVFVRDAASFAIAVNAIRAAGATAWPIGPEASAAEVAARLNACGARILVTAAPLAETAAEAADRSRVRQVFTFGEAPGTTPFRSLLGVAKHSADYHGADYHGAGYQRGEAGRAGYQQVGYQQVGYQRVEAGDGQPDQDDGTALQPGLTLSRRDVVIAGPPCGEGHAYTALLDLTLLAGATIVAAPVPLIAAAVRVYKGTAAIVPRDAHVPCLPSDRVFAVA